MNGRITRDVIFCRLFALFALFAITACGKSSVERYQQIALAQSAFATPVTLHLSGDANAQVSVLANLPREGDPPQIIDSRHYTSLTWSGGPDHAPGNYLGCAYNSDYSTPSPSNLSLSATVSANLPAFQDGTIMYNWMRNHDIIHVKECGTKYTNLDYSSGDNRVEWYCPVVNGQFASTHATPGTTNFHNSVDIILGNRQAESWTYSNAYETDLPGQGHVQVFAGTFSYTIIPSVPGIAFDNRGSGSVRMHLDPDTGKWTVDSYQLQEPTATLLDAGTPSAAYTQPPGAKSMSLAEFYRSTCLPE